MGWKTSNLVLVQAGIRLSSTYCRAEAVKWKDFISTFDSQPCRVTPDRMDGTVALCIKRMGLQYILWTGISWVVPAIPMTIQLKNGKASGSVVFMRIACALMEGAKYEPVISWIQPPLLDLGLCLCIYRTMINCPNPLVVACYMFTE